MRAPRSEFLAKYQRADGKIPHEISQSAGFVPWFTDFPYAWASADATPLYVIAHADAWRAGGDRAFLARHWPSIQKAYQFSAATDADRDGLIENTGVGHGWVEGGALYPAHEEIYLQGLWIEASRSFAALATEMGDRTAGDARVRQRNEPALPSRRPTGFLSLCITRSPPCRREPANRSRSQVPRANAGSADSSSSPIVIADRPHCAT